jgi:hypothetical protein
MKPLMLSFLLTCSITFNFAQQREIARCGNEYNEYTSDIDNELLTNNRVSSNTGVIYKIPVVFHVLTDQPTGVSNISDCIIRNQIDILNNCFRRKAGAPNTNAAGADAEIEFYLARKNPSGGATNGINRVTTSNCNYTTQGSTTQLNSFRTAAKWPVDKYLNIWVLKTTPTPTSSSIANGVRGEAFKGGTTITGSQDIGIFIHYSYVGSKNSGCANITYLDATGFKAYDLGMTLVHEVGHYLNLAHTYGTCGTNIDGCDDTPSVSGLPLAFCGTNNNTRGLCSGATRRQWENYLDYTDDACMDRFTACQVNRMRTQLTTIAFYKNLITTTNFTATGGDITTSVNEINQSDALNIKIFPNPFAEKITVLQKNITKSETYRIIDAFGKEIKRGFLTGNATSIDAVSIPDGVYFIEIKQSTYKLIKQ